VTVRIKRRGVEANPALVAPKMGNAYTKVSVAVRDCATWSTYGENNDEKEVHVGDIMKLEPQVLGNETEGGVFGGTNLVAGKVDDGVAILVFGVRRQRKVEEYPPSSIWCRLAPAIIIIVLRKVRLSVCCTRSL